MGKYIVETDQGQFEIETDDPAQANKSLPAPGDTLKFKEQDFLSRAYNVALPVGGTIAGGAVGTGAAPGAGTFAGGALGFGGGVALAKGIDRMRGMAPPLTPSQIIPETASNITEGVQAEMLGGIAGKAIPAVRGATGKGFSRLQQFLTGKPAQEFSRVAKDPGALLPSILGGPKSMKDASSSYGNYPKKIDVADDTTDLMVGAYRKATVGAEDYNLTDPGFIKEAVRKLEPGEAYKAYQATQTVLKNMVENKNPVLFRNRVIFKDALKDYLIEIDPAFGKTISNFARSALRNSMTDILPSNKYGTPSIGRAGFGAPILGPLGYAAGGPIGATAATMMGASPLVNAVGRAGMAATGNLLQKPTTAKSIFAIIKDQNRKRKK